MCSEDSKNPFMDPDAELDQAFVDEFACIGCRVVSAWLGLGQWEMQAWELSVESDW